MPYDPLKVFDLEPKVVRRVRDLRVSYSEHEASRLGERQSPDDLLRIASSNRAAASLSFILSQEEGREYASKASQYYERAENYYWLFLGTAFGHAPGLDINSHEILKNIMGELSEFVETRPLSHLPGALSIAQQRLALVESLAAYPDLINTYGGFFEVVLADLNTRRNQPYGPHGVPIGLMVDFLQASQSADPDHDIGTARELTPLVRIAWWMAVNLAHLKQDRFHWSRCLSPVGYIDLDLAGLVSLYEKRRHKKLEDKLEMSAKAFVAIGDIPDYRVDDELALIMEVLLLAGATPE